MNRGDPIQTGQNEVVVATVAKTHLEPWTRTMQERGFTVAWTEERSTGPLALGIVLVLLWRPIQSTLVYEAPK